MKAAVALQSCPMEALPHPESRHTVLTKLETNQYVLRVPRGGKSAVWKIFLHVTNLHEHKIDFVLCRYCCGLFMYKGYASGTSSLMNHGIRCLDRPKRAMDLTGVSANDGINVTHNNSNNVPINEEWPEEFKSRPFFTLNYLKRFKKGDRRSPSPVSPLKYSMSFKVETPHQQYESASAAGGGGTSATSPTYRHRNHHHHHMEHSSISPPSTSDSSSNCASLSHHHLHSDDDLMIPGRQSTTTGAKVDEDTSQQTGVLHHFYTALHLAAHNFGIPMETLLKLTGITINGVPHSAWIRYILSSYFYSNTTFLFAY